MKYLNQHKPCVKCFSIIVSFIVGLIFTACPGDKTADCDPGYHPCENDPSECCLDSTTHQANWIIDTLGMPGKDNVLYDAAVIDENNIWVVGEIYTDEYDSVHQNSFTVYNAAHWEGSEWELINIAMTGNSPAYPHCAIFVFNNYDYWTATSAAYHWNGYEWLGFGSSNSNWKFDGYVKAIWGTSSSNLFFIGDNGSIVHYNGTDFTKMETGTDVDLRSISGTDENNVWVSGWNYDDLHRILLHYDGDEWNKIIDDYSNVEGSSIIEGRIVGVYTDNPDFVWVLTHKGLYKCKSNTTGNGQWLGEQSDPTSWIYAFGGFSHNDLFYGGDFSRIWHYNGRSFHYYDDISDMGRIYGIAVDESIVVVVGELRNTSQGFVLRGYR